MGLSRRALLLAGLGLAAGGCASNAGLARRPGPGWPDAISPPVGPDDVVGSASLDGVGADSGGGEDAGGSMAPATRHAPTYGEQALLAELDCLPRSRWDARPPKLGDINPMDGIALMTAHHEGSPDPFYATSASATELRIHKIQHDHIFVRGWSDIGYHFVIDRVGRLWEARPIRYQGAHVKDHNKHNIGVMCLGNFMLQSPTTAQVQRLGQTLKQLMTIYHIPLHTIYTHRELMPTLCPGDNMQPHVNRMRTDGYL